LVGKPEGMRKLGKPRRRQDNNIKMNCGEIGWMMWTGLIWIREGRAGGLF
jgi:hypothetical protein